MKSELIKRAESLLNANNIAYSPTKLAEIIEAGTIPNGATLAVSGNQTVKLENDAVVCYVDGKPAKTTPVVDAMRDTILVQYAVMASAISTGTGIPLRTVQNWASGKRRAQAASVVNQILDKITK